MSDFIYSKKKIENGILTKEIQRIYQDDKPSVQEFHGEWGSLAVSDNIYNGFQLYETDDHIFVVIGGPLLCFQDKQFLEGNPTSEGTKQIYERIIKGLITWDEDLSGPFAILFINKKTAKVECITDLMSFIPVYSLCDSGNILLSTHVDVLARASGQQYNIDFVSEADFILHGVVTYPYTIYKNIRQIAPASKHLIVANNTDIFTENYWLPREKEKYNSIGQAAYDLRQALQNYVNNIAGSMTKIGQFISGGEDSRLLSGLLPRNSTRDAFIFLDNMNREGKVAKKAAQAYGANFNVELRSNSHYIDILPVCHHLVGSGAQYHHVHTFGFHKKCMLNEYPAVFGGLFADALLKGSRIKKIRSSVIFPFLPQIKNSNYSAAAPVRSGIFNKEVLSQLNNRRQDHLNYVSSFRNNSADEWFELWPSSMNMSIPNIYGNRRLFRSYEPFMSKDVIKISASIPQRWKLNRRLFRLTAKPLLKQTKWLLHGEGRLPYFPWYFNMFVQFLFWSYYQIGKRIGLIKGNQGPWGEWNTVIKSTSWERAMDDYSDGIKRIEKVLKEKNVRKLFNDTDLNQMQQINLMQVIYSLSQKSL